jgi:prefoldin alpha subunit
MNRPLPLFVDVSSTLEKLNEQEKELEESLRLLNFGEHVIDKQASTLVPVGNGLFVHADLHLDKDILFPIGDDYFIFKSRDTCVALLDKKLQWIEHSKENLIKKSLVASGEEIFTSHSISNLEDMLKQLSNTKKIDETSSITEVDVQGEKLSYIMEEESDGIVSTHPSSTIGSASSVPSSSKKISFAWLEKFKQLGEVDEVFDEEKEASLSVSTESLASTSTKSSVATKDVEETHAQTRDNARKSTTRVHFSEDTRKESVGPVAPEVALPILSSSEDKGAVLFKEHAEGPAFSGVVKERQGMQSANPMNLQGIKKEKISRFKQMMQASYLEEEEDNALSMSTSQLK